METNTNSVIESTWICTYCGEEVESGLLRMVRHRQSCTWDAPNMNIEDHRRFVALTENREKEEREFQPVWNKMTAEEQMELTALSLNGFVSGDTILMGGQAFDNYYLFREKMKKKYG